MSGHFGLPGLIYSILVAFYDKPRILRTYSKNSSFPAGFQTFIGTNNNKSPRRHSNSGVHPFTEVSSSQTTAKMHDPHPYLRVATYMYNMCGLRTVA